MDTPGDFQKEFFHNEENLSSSVNQALHDRPKCLNPGSVFAKEGLRHPFL